MSIIPKMSVPAGKTPISFLQEICTKKGITPQYDLIANEGAVHEPTFVIRVSVGEVTATGKGSSKKKAKHCAAQAALKEILGVNGEFTPEEEKPQSKEENGGSSNGQAFDEGVPGNPIGELQEFTQKKLIKPPVYEFADEQGPAHAREFVCIVKLGKHQEKGTGRSKKTAKRAAASTMLTYIRSLEGEEKENVVEEDLDEEDEIPLPAEPRRSAYTALKEGKKVPVTSPLQVQQIQQFYEQIMKSSPKSVQALQAQPLNIPTTNYCQMLQEIAEVQRFEVTYIDIREISVSGMRQCLVQLSTMPVAVCHGTGATIDDAHGQAAHNTLQYLKVMMSVKS
ncbi:interferon-inducible double-stranded RNA-dependent protein kinase activator A homolog isoform X2 [Liolophura sinensis]|uniref:interferon-inducible double-stranded RNA-dependent protein kinase activator A homolog isoform X2 n=1 Tax=Liolophura sinensis TaxID=3198878 RepID=UPI003157FD83